MHLLVVKAESKGRTCLVRAGSSFDFDWSCVQFNPMCAINYSVGCGHAGKTGARADEM